MIRARTNRIVLGGLLLAGASSCVVLGYVAYVETRVADAIDAAARAAGLEAEYESAQLVGLDRIDVRGLALADPDREFEAELSLLESRFTPRFGSPRLVFIRLPLQDAAVRVGGLRGEAKLQGGVGLRAAATSQAMELRAAELTLQNGRLSSRTQAAPGLSARFEYTAGEQLASSPARLSIRGPAAGALLTASGWGGVRDWLFPEDLAGPFDLRADVHWRQAALRLDRIAGHAGSLAVQGGLVLRDEGANGALLVTTGVRDLGLRIVRGELKSELAPAPDWLEQQLSLAGIPPRDSPPKGENHESETMGNVAVGVAGARL